MPVSINDLSTNCGYFIKVCHVNIPSVPGEYISLYQMQRGVLRKRQEEREDYIWRLARDREEMSGKLAQLQALVMQLLGERKMLHAYKKNTNTTEIAQNHIQPHLVTKTNNNSNFGAKLESSNLEGGSLIVLAISEFLHFSKVTVFFEW